MPASLRSRLGLPLVCLAILALLPTSAPAIDRDQPDLTLPTVVKKQASVTTIAIPAFVATNDPKDVDAGVFHEVIYNDLEIFSDFERVANQGFVEDAHGRDAQSGKTDFAEWQRLSANFVLKGHFSVDEEMIHGRCQLWDVVYGHSVMHRRYKYPLPNARRMAHHISDDIVRAVFKEEVAVASTKISFVSLRGASDQKEIYVMDADGHDQRRMTWDTSLTATPCWGQNATEIYYTSYRDNNPDLCGVQIGTARTWYISRRPVMNISPNWNPRSERIVLTLGRDGNSEIYTMARDGSERSVQRLTYTSAIDSSPCFSPSGKQIVFTSSRTGYPQVYVMDDDGLNVRRLTRQGRYNDSAVWSPLGDKIAFVGRDRNIFNVYVMNVDGEGWRQLTARQGNNEDPAWAPDGKHLVFSSNRSGSYQLYIMRNDGTDQHRLTNQGTNQSPAWSPLLP